MKKHYHVQEIIIYFHILALNSTLITNLCLKEYFHIIIEHDCMGKIKQKYAEV